MKKIRLTILLTMLLCMFGPNALAHDIEVENADGVKIYYNYINDGTELEVTCQGNNTNSCAYSGTVVIPEEVTYMNMTRKVTSIGGWAFSACSGLTSVTIPNNVTNVGYSVFQGCTNLKDISIGNGLTTIEEMMFYECSSIVSINIPSSVTAIKAVAFGGCSSLTSIVLHENITTINGSAFFGCSNLKELTIEDGNNELFFTNPFISSECTCFSTSYLCIRL